MNTEEIKAERAPGEMAGSAKVHVGNGSGEVNGSQLSDFVLAARVNEARARAALAAAEEVSRLLELAEAARELVCVPVPPVEVAKFPVAPARGAILFCREDLRDEGPWVSLKRAAVLLGISARSLRRMFERGELKQQRPFEHRRAAMVATADVARFLPSRVLSGRAEGAA